MPALLERPKMTRTMYHALKRHILKERERKKQEQEQDAMMERLRKERELKKKKEEEDSLTLEQTKEQVSALEVKLETLKTEKHDLFSRLKKVLHQEDETRRRTQIKEQQSEMLLHAQQGFPSHGIPVSGHPVMIQQISGRPALYKPPSSIIGVKRTRSPSPPPSTSYQGYSYTPAKQATHIYQHQQADFKQGNYPQGQPVHVTYASQPGHTYQQQSVVYSSSQSPASKYNPASQSAFTSYPSHYAQHQQKQPIENYPPGYVIQRMQQQAAGYIASPHNPGIPIQQPLEHASQKSSFNEEKYKIQQVREQQRNYQSEAWPAGAYPFPRGGLRNKAPQMTGQQPAAAAMLQQQIQVQQAASSKGSIVTGYPARTQAPASSTYQPPTQSTYHSQQSGRPN
ncbi:G protein pathway suppressor 2-like isoform X1 [Haliotis asinina]|uniref:G protein pathway suppressor 2-like isoform X1 n=1 Tax=Haliotis asinina TaxID=109174 RepID=UPI003531C8CB